jgi:hypothetical protein
MLLRSHFSSRVLKTLPFEIPEQRLNHRVYGEAQRKIQEDVVGFPNGSLRGMCLRGFQSIDDRYRDWS